MEHFFLLTVHPNILATSYSYTSDSKKTLFNLNAIFLITSYVICKLEGNRQIFEVLLLKILLI